MGNYNINQIKALQTSQHLLQSTDVANISLQTGKDILQGKVPPPRNLGEALQLFTNGLVGKPSDPFYYRSQYGLPLYNYLLIKGEQPPRNGERKRSDLETLSAFRVNYINPEGSPNPNTFEQLNNDLTTNTISFPAIFMDSALITVSKKKNIIKTKVLNRDSTRKEYINSNDYDINISGVFATDSSNRYPVADVDALIRACEAPIPLEVISPQLFRFGITSLVVDSFSFPQEMGSYSTQKFSMKCISHNSEYVDIATEQMNENQKKVATASAIDYAANLRSTVSNQIEDFLLANPFG
tara:strand:+ start:16 stop:906 length:891 start_codon:yes stop_codon:yes gene_type:complete